jgi:hypothetical protein
VLLCLCTDFTHNLVCHLTPFRRTCFPTYNLTTPETPMGAICINSDLPQTSSLDVCFNKHVTNICLPVLINCDCKIARDTPANTLLHTKPESRAVTTRHLSLQLSTNITKLMERNLKPLEGNVRIKRRFVIFTQLRHCMLVSPRLVYCIACVKQDTEEDLTHLGGQCLAAQQNYCTVTRELGGSRRCIRGREYSFHILTYSFLQPSYNSATGNKHS